MRTKRQKIKDFFTFPFRAFLLFEIDKFGLSSLQTERYDYVSAEVEGRCLDVGCGRHNRFIKQFYNGNGVGIDVFRYEGLDESNIVPDMTKLPYTVGSFDSATLIANINHIPKSIRKREIKEIYRVIKNSGRIVVTMGNPVVEVMVHKVVWFYDKFFKTNVDVDSERGMEKDEEYFLTDDTIKELLSTSGFKNIKKKYFWTQWGLNHLFVAVK
jgi:ubiquinone/menaquinone biosynthesis C-methylase UbiE